MAGQCRIERDSMGEVAVPETALYGAQTQRAVDNFRLSPRTLPASFLRRLAAVKAAAELAGRYLRDRRLPDKAIDLLKATAESRPDPAVVDHAWREVSERGYYDPEVLSIGYLVTGR